MLDSNKVLLTRSSLKKLKRFSKVLSQQGNGLPVLIGQDDGTPTLHFSRHAHNRKPDLLPFHKSFPYSCNILQSCSHSLLDGQNQTSLEQTVF